jgi:hypothetical protein
MKDIKISLAKPFGRENETAQPIKLEFECAFDNQVAALKFHEKLNRLVLDNMTEVA